MLEKQVKAPNIDFMTEQDDVIRMRVRARMAELKLTQVELARRLGIKPPSLAQILNGRRGRVPKSLLDVLNALALRLEVVPDDQEEKNE